MLSASEASENIWLHSGCFKIIWWRKDLKSSKCIIFSISCFINSLPADSYSYSGSLPHPRPQSHETIQQDSSFCQPGGGDNCCDINSVLALSIFQYYKLVSVWSAQHFVGPRLHSFINFATNHLMVPSSPPLCFCWSQDFRL